MRKYVLVEMCRLLVYNGIIIFNDLAYNKGDATLSTNILPHNLYTFTLGECSKEIQWLDKKLYLTSQKDNAKNRIVKRNEVYWCNFGVGVGSEMDKLRPCVIIQVNSYNSTSGNTIVAPITHDDPTYSCMIPIDTRRSPDGGILLDGAINVSNLMCVCKSRLGDPISQLNDKEIKMLNTVLYQHLAIDSYVKHLENKIKKKDEYIEQIKEKRKADVEFINELKTLCEAKNKTQIKSFIKNSLQSNENRDKINSNQ